MEQLAVTAMAALLAVICGDGLSPITVAGMLLAVCCTNLTQWLLPSHDGWACLPSICLGLAVLAAPTLLIALPAAGYAAARTFRHGHPAPASCPVSTRALPRTVFAWCAALSWTPACIRLSLQALRGKTPAMFDAPTAHDPALVCTSCLLCIIAFMLGDSRRKLADMSSAWRHAHDERRALARDLTTRLEDSADERQAAVRMATLNERTRIARDIHDNVGHLLTRAIMQTEACKVDDAPIGSRSGG